MRRDGILSSEVSTDGGRTSRSVSAHGEKTALSYLRRAFLLRCPVCGIYPIFLPFFHTRSLHDWFTPLDGCPRCGYPYEREPGYFLVSTWVINYGAGSLLGIIIYVILDCFTQLDIRVLLTAVLTPIFIFNLLFARHSKALFIAVDHFYDPHEKDSGEDGGNLPLPKTPPSGTAGPSKPIPTPSAPVKPARKQPSKESVH